MFSTVYLSTLSLDIDSNNSYFSLLTRVWFLSGTQALFNFDR